MDDGADGGTTADAAPEVGVGEVGADELTGERQDGFDIESGPQTVVTVTGELDAQSAAQLRTLLARAFDAQPDVVIVDLRDVSFIDSVGLSVLVTAHNRGESQSTSFEVRNSSPACLRVFEITRLVDVFRLT